MTTNQILIGIGLILVLAVGAQVLASRLRIPALIVLPANGVLPAGHDVLFLVRAEGQLAAVTQTGTTVPQDGDTVVSLGPVPVASSHSG